MRSFPAFASVAAPTTLVAAASLLALSFAPTASGDPGSAHSGGHSGAHSGDHASAHAERWDTPLGFVQGTHKPQTSDGVIGRIAPTVPFPLRGYGDTSQRASWRVAPGIKAAIWDRDDARGPVREYLLSIKYRTRGITIDTMTNGPVRAVGTVPSMVKRSGAVAGVNGDFYDIGDTGAPLGIDRNRARGVINGRLTGWNQAFYLTRSGVPEIGRLVVNSWIKERPGITITNYNGPSVIPNGIGLYTSDFGWSTPRVTDGQSARVRTVHVVGGRVVSNVPHPPTSHAISGQLLVGRGSGADKLAALHKGAKATIKTGIPERPAMALTGNQFLVDNGIIRVTDDREMAPRTAVGIDRDTHEILILAVDGRQSFSRGFTMVELANQMIDLGADEALNLDGGGSTTMVARHHGAEQVINSPSDGFLRAVANGLAIHYTKPKAAPSKHSSGRHHPSRHHAGKHNGGRHHASKHAPGKPTGTHR